MDVARTLLARAKPLPPRVEGYLPPQNVVDTIPKFLAKVVRPESDCYSDEWYFERHWTWTGVARADGQRFIDCKGQRLPILNFVWLYHQGPIPTGKFPRPVCGEHVCVNPSHLRLRDRSGGGVLSRRAQIDVYDLYHHNQPPLSVASLAKVFRTSERTIRRVIDKPRPAVTTPTLSTPWRKGGAWRSTTKAE